MDKDKRAQALETAMKAIGELTPQTGLRRGLT